MTAVIVKNEEGQLLNLLNDLGELAWQKYQQRFPTVAGNVVVDRSSFPPFISFRFEREQAEIVNRLLLAINQYNGDVEWVMVGRNREGLPGVNWLICPRKSFELREKAEQEGLHVNEYLALHEPEFGPVAYQDLRALTCYMYDFFGLKKE